METEPLIPFMPRLRENIAQQNTLYTNIRGFASAGVKAGIAGEETGVRKRQAMQSGSHFAKNHGFTLVAAPPFFFCRFQFSMDFLRTGETVDVDLGCQRSVMLLSRSEKNFLEEPALR